MLHVHCKVFVLKEFDRRTFPVLVWSSDSRLSLRSLSPFTDEREDPPVPHIRHMGGNIAIPTEALVSPHLVFVKGHTTQAERRWVPARLLEGVLPACLLEAFQFWAYTIQGEALIGCFRGGK